MMFFQFHGPLSMFKTGYVFLGLFWAENSTSFCQEETRFGCLLSAEEIDQLVEEDAIRHRFFPGGTVEFPTNSLTIKLLGLTIILYIYINIT